MRRNSTDLSIIQKSFSILLLIYATLRDKFDKIRI